MKRNERSIRLEWIAAFLDGRDIPYYACKVAEGLQRSVVIASAAGRVLAFHDPTGSGIVLGNFCPQVSFGQDWRNLDLMTCLELPGTRGEWLDSGGNTETEYLAVPLVSEAHLLGYLCLLGEPALTEEEREYLWEAALAVLLVIKETERWQKEEEGYQTEFIRDILYNNYDSRQAILDKARFWHWDLNGAWALIVAEERVNSSKSQDSQAGGKVPGSAGVKVPGSAGVKGPGVLAAGPEGKLKDWIVRALPLVWQGHGQETRRPHAIILNAQLLVLIPLPGGEKRGHKMSVSSFRQDFMESGWRLGLGLLDMGVGTFADSIDGLYKVYQEAKLALELGKAFAYTGLCYFTEMGLLKFVFSQPARELQEFAQRILGAVSEYDRETEAGLLDTMLAYFEARMQVPDCARTLFIHENTLRSRLKKVEQLTGYDLHRVDHLANLYIALQVMRLGGEPSP